MHTSSLFFYDGTNCTVTLLFIPMFVILNKATRYLYTLDGLLNQ